MGKPRKNKTPSYTEAQSKRWLSWLARGMQAHGQTVFMIEQLQPSWLPTRRQRAVYTFTSRLMAGLIYGLIIGIGSAWICSGTYVVSIVFIFLALIGGFTFGMTIACLDQYRFNRSGKKLEPHEVPTGWRRVAGVLIVGVVFGLTVAAILVLTVQIVLICNLFIVLFWSYQTDSYWKMSPTIERTIEWTTVLISAVLVIGITSAAVISVLRLVQYVRRDNRPEQRTPPTGWRQGVFLVGAVISCHLAPTLLAVLWGLSVNIDLESVMFLITPVCILAVVFSIICGMRQRTLECDIQTVETLNWSWARGRKGVLIGTPGLATGVFLAFWFAVMDAGLRDQRIVAGSLLFALFFGLIPGLFLVMGGFRPRVAEMKTSPNKGIILSMRSAAFVGLVFGLSLAVILSLLPLVGRMAPGWPFGLVVTLKIALILGLMSTFIAGSWFGGLDVFNHYLLRLTLYLFGFTPFNYVRFLDYAAKDLNFLQKVGGGYIFIHRILLEHFAAMEDEGMSKPQDTPPVVAPMFSESVSDN